MSGTHGHGKDGGFELYQRKSPASIEKAVRTTTVEIGPANVIPETFLELPLLMTHKNCILVWSGLDFSLRCEKMCQNRRGREKSKPEEYSL